MDCDLDTGDFLHADPLLGPDHRAKPGSPALDKALRSFDFHGDEITPEPIPFTGGAPDLGAHETS